MAWQQITDPVQMQQLAEAGLLYIQTPTHATPELCPEWRVFPHVASFFYCIQVEA